MTEWMKGNELETRAAERRSRRHDAARRLSGAADAGQPRRRHLRLDPRSRERHRHRYEVNIDYRERLEANGPAVLRHVAGRPAARDRRAARPSVVHRRAVPPRAEVAARSSRIRCSPASSQRRWSRAGWCERAPARPSRHAGPHLDAGARGYLRSASLVAPEAAHPFGTGNACVFFSFPAPIWSRSPSATATRPSRRRPAGLVFGQRTDQRFTERRGEGFAMAGGRTAGCRGRQRALSRTAGIGDASSLPFFAPRATLAGRQEAASPSRLPLPPMPGRCRTPASSPASSTSRRTSGLGLAGACQRRALNAASSCGAESPARLSHFLALPSATDAAGAANNSLGDAAEAAPRIAILTPECFSATPRRSTRLPTRGGRASRRFKIAAPRRRPSGALRPAPPRRDMPRPCIAVPQLARALERCLASSGRPHGGPDPNAVVEVGAVPLGNAAAARAHRRARARWRAATTRSRWPAALKEIAARLGIGLVYKTVLRQGEPHLGSAAKRGHRASTTALPIFAEMRSDARPAGARPTCTRREQCAAVAEVVDVLQIPAFLCRQTDLLVAAAEDRARRQRQEGPVPRALGHEERRRQDRRQPAIRTCW